MKLSEQVEDGQISLPARVSLGEIDRLLIRLSLGNCTKFVVWAKLCLCFKFIIVLWNFKIQSYNVTCNFCFDLDKYILLQVHEQQESYSRHTEISV